MVRTIEKGAFMSEKSQLFRLERKPKLLVIGTDAQVLALVVDEARQAGIDVRGMTASEADGALTGRFDIVAFGGAIAPGQRRSLEREALFHNPQARFINLYAPFAASQIVAAARDEDAP